MSSIFSCPSCATVILPQEAGTICPKCRTPLPQSAIDTVMPQDLPGMDDVTRLAAPSVSQSKRGGSHSSSRDREIKDSRPSSSSGWLSSSGAIDHGRFEPGTLLGGRYRIVERRGRGGMGEVYRADDLKLGQPVALKFLPEEVDRDPARLTQLHTEVRMARQVSHPNVCRVYDIDEIAGTTFLSMEYVDGEDLSSLLKRVGRFPEDRALEIARQICAGLAAAHDCNVIHRDLKPANVMLDGTGKVRITDFGLAGASGEAIRAGTPAYMAPEQLAGNEVTARSDVYALGLVLYEIFTGQRALDGKNLAELIHKREQSGIVPPTALVKGLDVKIERAILKCLRPEIDERPASALAVAAMFPGGDPLAAALAAGETPSPAMVAAAATREAISVRAVAAAVAWIVISLIAVIAIYQRVMLLNRVPLPKPPAVLEDRARDILTALGVDPATATDTASGIGISTDYVDFIERTSTAPDRWAQLRTVRPETFFYWFRSSPQRLIPWGSENQVTRSNPPLTTVGMTLLAVDGSGRLSEFHRAPSPISTDAAVVATDWGKLFTLAGLDFAKFSASPPTIVPPFFANERQAWEGPLADREDLNVRVEGASMAGKPVYFAVTGQWGQSGRLFRSGPSLFLRIVSGLASVIMPGLMVVGAILARRNLKRGSGDRAGAFRVATFVFATSFIAWLLGASHVTLVDVEIRRIFGGIGRGLLDAGILWLTYLGLEPYARRYAPDSILGWTRLVTGHWRDPRVGVDVLVGVCVGLAMTIVYAMHNLLPPLAGFPEPAPLISKVTSLNGLRFVFSDILLQLTDAISSSMLAVAGVVGFVLLLRSRVLAALTAIVCFTPAVINGMFPGRNPVLDVAMGVCIITIFIVTILRAGLLSAVAALFTHFVLLRAPITTDFASWHASVGIWHVAVVLVAGLGASYIARHGRSDAVTTS